MKQDIRSSTRRRLVDTLIRGVLAGIVLSAVFLAGFFLGGQMPVGAQNSDGRGEFPLLDEARSLLQAHYLRPLPDARTMEHGAIRGYLEVLDDPFTYFVEPPVAQNESDVLAGQYGGIGAQLKLNERGFFVLYPFPEGPATEAGVQDGDILLAVNGEAIAPGTRLDAVERLLRGEVGEGRGVTLTLRRPESEETREIFVPFAVVQVPSVVWRVLAEEPRIGYVQIIRFTARTPDELRTALDELEGQGVEALVLDLRSNSGGLLQEAVEVASEFLDDGVIFYEVTRDGETAKRADPGGKALDQPLAVLVNHGTASAAELVAGALRDHGRGVLIGQQTYGKGSVQYIFRLADESSIHITAAEWFTPNRDPINGVGLVPDISMIPAEDGRDVELGEAIRQLREQLSQTS